MIASYLLYTLKAAVLLAVFHLFFRLLMSRVVLHRLARVVLLVSMALSIVLPLCVITWHRVVVLPSEGSGDALFELPQAVTAEHVGDDNLMRALFLIYIVGVAAVMIKTAVALLSVVRLIRRSERFPQEDGTVQVVNATTESPFSWFRYIILSPRDYAEQNQFVLAHEAAHARLHHSADVLTVDLLSALQWFNPAVWLMRSDLRAIHEFEADDAVLSQGADLVQYQYLLIKKAVSDGGYSIANGFTHSTLKQRIYMMQNKNNSAKRHYLRVLYLVPVALVALAVNARTIVDYVEPASLPAKTAPAAVDSISTFTLNGDFHVATNAKPNELVFFIDGKKATKDEATAINAEDIEAMNVLKDGSAAEKYGEDANTIVVEIKTKSKVLDLCEVMPEYPGGMEALMKYLQESVKYPKEAQAQKLQGRVIVRFVVERDGQISHVEMPRSVHPLLDAEAIRVVKAMPKWTPGREKGEPVAVHYSLPITFRLN